MKCIIANIRLKIIFHSVTGRDKIKMPLLKREIEILAFPLHETDVAAIALKDQYQYIVRERTDPVKRYLLLSEYVQNRCIGKIEFLQKRFFINIMDHFLLYPVYFRIVLEMNSC